MIPDHDLKLHLVTTSGDSEQVRFLGSRGAELAGRLHQAAEPRGGVLLAHCFTCSKDLAVNTRLAAGLAAAGYHVLRFDFTGLGESGGDFERSTIGAHLGDLLAAAQWMIDHRLGPTALVGHSLGGAAVLLGAARIRPVKAVVTIGAPSDPGHIRALIDKDAEARAHQEGCIYVEIAGRTFPISDALLHDLDRYPLEEVVAVMGKPLLVIHPGADRVVPITEGERIFSFAAQPKSFVPLPGSDHLLTRPEDTERAVELVRAWLDTYS